MVLANIYISLSVVDFCKRKVRTTKSPHVDTSGNINVVTKIPWYWLPHMPTSWWIYVCAGVVCCTFVMPALINDAIFKIPLAMLLTLESIGPLYSLPISWIIQKDVPGLNACVGALLAVGGIGILSFKGMTMNMNSTT
jgi:drug/metabolite transporter (DMT)-like permease